MMNKEKMLKIAKWGVLLLYIYLAFFSEIKLIKHVSGIMRLLLPFIVWLIFFKEIIFFLKDSDDKGIENNTGEEKIGKVRIINKEKILNVAKWGGIFFLVLCPWVQQFNLPSCCSGCCDDFFVIKVLKFFGLIAEIIAFFSICSLPIICIMIFFKRYRKKCLFGITWVIYVILISAFPFYSPCIYCKDSVVNDAEILEPQEMPMENKFLEQENEKKLKAEFKAELDNFTTDKVVEELQEKGCFGKGCFGDTGQLVESETIEQKGLDYE